MYIEKPDSRYARENLVQIDTNTLCEMDAAASRMAWTPREDAALTDDWRAAEERTQAELMSRARRARRSR